MMTMHLLVVIYGVAALYEGIGCSKLIRAFDSETTMLCCSYTLFNLYIFFRKTKFLMRLLLLLLQLI